ncbi:MAG: transferrin-binding protein-like solute binding protein [Pseudomonadota bacterium]
MIIPPLRPVLLPIALLLPMVLAACGGGGGSSSGLAPNSPTYNEILFGSPATIDGTLQNYRLNSSAITPASGSGNDNKIEGTVKGNSGTLTAIDITVTFQGSHLFTETFDNFTTTTETDSEFGVAYKFQKIDAADGSVRKMTFFEPQALGLRYSALGIWEYETSPGANPSQGGYFSMGAITHGSDIPISGSATYNGKLIGTYTDGTAVYAVGANASATADFTFTSPSVTLSTSDTQVVQKGTSNPPTPRVDLNLSGKLTYPGGTNNLTGTLTTTNNLTGPASARFYGPQAAELGGTFFVKNASDTEQMVGGFALKKQ